ncbi:MAG: Mov34/MPN/PAD-1 family protein [Nitrososphaeraceae archaeon]
MLFRNKSKKDSKLVRERQVIITRQAADGIITYSKTWHPNEGILILRGKSNKDKIVIDGLILPPFSLQGPYYSGFPTYDLPFDLSYVGTAHSHPSGSNRPSLEDLNNYFGSVSIIISYPYADNTIAAFDRDGNHMQLEIMPFTHDI